MTFVPGGNLSPGGQMTKYPTQPGVLLDFYGNPLSGVAAAYIPGVVADGTTDNLATINNYLSAFAAANPGGGVPVQILPPGKVALSAPFTPPTGVFLQGSGNEQRSPAWTNTGQGTTLVPTAGFAGAQLVQLSNPNSGLIALNVDGGTTVDPFMVSAVDCSIDSVSIYGGVAHCLNSTSTSNRFGIGGRNVNIAPRAAGLNPGGIPALDANGLDWQIIGDIRFTGGTKNLSGGGCLWAGTHFTNSGPSQPNVTDNGGQIFVGCYFDSTNATTPPCLISHPVTSEVSVYAGCRYYQSTAGVSGLPVFLERSTLGVVVSGGWVSVSGAQTWTAFIDGATVANTIDNVRFGGSSPTVGFYTNGQPGAGRGNVVLNTPVPDIVQYLAVTTTTFTANAYTFVLADQNTHQIGNNLAVAATYTVPANASVAFPIGTQIEIFQGSAGKMQIAAAGGVTIDSAVAGGFVSGSTGCRAQFSVIRLIKQNTNQWTISGDAA